MKYNEYMKSDLWQENRKKALIRDHFKCQLCGSAKNIRVHHIHYPKDFKYDNIDNLVCLCDICHKSIHENDIKKKNDTFYKDRRKNQYISTAFKSFRILKLLRWIF